MTRDDDRSVPMTDRTAIANNSKADMFISLHANASFRDAVSGASVYVAAFDPDQVAANRVTSERLPALGGGVRDIELVPWNLAQIRHKDQSDAFATLVVDALKEHVPLAPTASGARAAARPRIGEHACGPGGGRVSDQCGAGEADRQQRISDGGRPGLIDAIVRYRDIVAPAEGASR